MNAFMTDNIEIEYKQMVDNAQYLKVKSYLLANYNVQTIEQTNHYFVDNDGELAQREMALRIREKNGTYEICLKAAGAQAILEKNIIITKVEFDKIMAQPNRLNQYYDELAYDLRYVGQLHTKRLETQWQGNTLCLDKSNYLNNEDYEIEFEAKDFKQEQLLKVWLSDLDIKYKPNKLSKIGRFLKALNNVK